MRAKRNFVLALLAPVLSVSLGTAHATGASPRGVTAALMAAQGTPSAVAGNGTSSSGPGQLSLQNGNPGSGDPAGSKTSLVASSSQGGLREQTSSGQSGAASGQSLAGGGSGSGGMAIPTRNGCALRCHVTEQTLVTPAPAAPAAPDRTRTPPRRTTSHHSSWAHRRAPRPRVLDSRSAASPQRRAGSSTRARSATGTSPTTGAGAARFARTAAAAAHTPPRKASLRTTVTDPVGVNAQPLRSRLPAATTDQPSVIQRFVAVVPEAVWAALAAALLLAAVAGAAAVWSGARVRRQAGRFAEMSVAALTDPLTGVLNRRGFTEAADRELERARRYGRPLAIAYVDVRGLKAVNDTEGHLAGDRLLRAAARLLTDSARANDVVGRLGGDELGMLLVEQTPEGANAASKRIEAEVVDRRASIGLQSPWDLTVGTSTFPGDGETIDELLRAADMRLYEQRGIEIH